jgi:hypothetical protein
MHRLATVGTHLASFAPTAAGEGRVIEKRVYYSPSAEKLDALHRRIREHGLKLVRRQQQQPAHSPHQRATTPRRTHSFAMRRPILTCLGALRWVG